MDKPILLEVVAPILDRVGLCVSCGVVLQGAGLDRGHDAYPEEWQKEFDTTWALVRRAMETCGDGLTVRWSDPRSFRGLYLSLRHAIRRYPAFVLNKRQKFVGVEQAAAGLLPLLERA